MQLTEDYMYIEKKLKTESNFTLEEALKIIQGKAKIPMPAPLIVEVQPVQ